MINSNESGFTLVELLVAMALTAVLGVTIAYTFRVQAFTHKTQEAVAALQQNLRTAMFFIEGDLRLTGSDPNGNATISGDTSENNGKKAGILTAENGNVTDTPILKLAMNRSDPPEDADFSAIIGDEDREIVEYDVAESEGVLALRSNTQPVAEWITSLSLQYFDKDGNDLVIGGESGVRSDRLDQVRLVRVTLQGQIPVELGDIQKTLTSDVWLRNMVGR